MKKVFLTLSSIVIISFCYAQINIGVKGGVNISRFTTKINNGNNFSSPYGVGLNAGFFVPIKLGKNIYLQPELEFSQNAIKLTDTSSVSLNYLALPLLFKYTFPIKLSLYAGPRIGLLLSARGKEKGVSTNIINLYRAADFSTIIGAEYALMDILNLSARYQFGMTKIVGNFIGDDLLNGFTITVGYTIKK